MMPGGTGLQEQLGACDTAMPPAKFRGVGWRHEDVLGVHGQDALGQELQLSLGALPRGGRRVSCKLMGKDQRTGYHALCCCGHLLQVT